MESQRESYISSPSPSLNQETSFFDFGPTPAKYTMRVISIPEENNTKEIERGSWNSQWEPIFSCLCFMIGIGNLWGFPIKALENGCGTFVIIYIGSVDLLSHFTKVKCDSWT